MPSAFCISFHWSAKWIGKCLTAEGQSKELLMCKATSTRNVLMMRNIILTTKVLQQRLVVQLPPHFNPLPLTVATLLLSWARGIRTPCD